MKLKSNKKNLQFPTSQTVLMCFSMSSPNRPQAYNPPPTMDHFHTKLAAAHAKHQPSLSAFHLDDFLRPLIADDENNHHHNTTTTTTTTTNIQQIIHNYYNHHNPHSPSSSTSSSSPPFALVNSATAAVAGTGRKGVEDVWFNNVGVGETTLEEFLIGKGAINPVISETTVNTNAQQISVIDPMVVSQPTDWLQQQQQQQLEHEIEVLGQNLPMQQGLLYGNSNGDIGYNENQIGMSVQPTTVIEAAASGLDVDRKRKLSDEMIEKTIERKQKRMIKNRESAARSRARKQAYTNKLEQDVSVLKEANAALEKEMVLTRLPFDPNSRPKHQLKILPFRRANSATF